VAALHHEEDGGHLGAPRPDQGAGRRSPRASGQGWSL